LGSVPTLLAVLVAGYVARAYFQAERVVASRAEIDRRLVQIARDGAAWAAEHRAIDPSQLQPIEHCQSGVAPGPPSALMAYIAASPSQAAVNPLTEPELVGASPWGPAVVPLARPLKDEALAQTVLALLEKPGRVDTLSHWREHRAIPSVAELRYLAVVSQAEPPNATTLIVSLHHAHNGDLICRGQMAFVPRLRLVPAPRSPRGAGVDIAFDEATARQAALRFSPLERLCRVGGTGWCRQVAAAW
jgi:hypothetical protein